MADMVSEQRVATKENVQRKQARTEGERDDSDAEVSASESEGEDAEDVPYNPKNLPLGESDVIFLNFTFHVINPLLLNRTKDDMMYDKINLSPLKLLRSH